MGDPWDWERKEFVKAMKKRGDTEDETLVEIETRLYSLELIFICRKETSDDDKSKPIFEINPEDFDVNPFNF